MLENLSFQYSPWYILIGLLVGLIVASTLYYKNRITSIKPINLRRFLYVLRTASIVLLFFLLIGPLLKRVLTDEKKPLFIVAQDHTTSIPKIESKERQNTLISGLKAMQTSLAEKYEVVPLHFGEKVENGLVDSFTASATNLSGLFDFIQNQYGDQNLRGIVLATDGLYNQGNNPSYHIQNLNSAIYPIPLGDTSPRRDLFLKNIFHNRIAYLEDKFSVQVDIAAQNAKGSSSLLTVYERVDGKNKELQKFPVQIDKNDFFTTQEVILEANRPGMQQYVFSLTKIGDEISTENNIKQIFVDILDAKQKILLVGAAPHPDLSAFKQSLTSNKNYDVTIAYSDELPENTKAFDLLILHQLPSIKNNFQSFISSWKSSNKPLLFVVGKQTDLRRLNDLQNILDIKTNTRNSNYVQANINSDFNYYTLTDEQKQFIPAYPPIIAPFAEVAARPGSQTLLEQKIGKVDTDYPLLAMSQTNPKTGILMGEGIWKWRLLNYARTENFEAFDLFVSKLIQFLTVKDNKKRFRINLPKNLFKENESITFQAEVYNDSYELINTPDVTMSILNNKGESFNFTYNKTTDAYKLNVGSLPYGDYTYKGQVVLNGEQFETSGKFTVSPIQLELFNLVADHRTLNNLAQESGGKVIALDSLKRLSQSLLESESSKPILYQTTKTNDILSQKWLFFLLLFMLALEWFLRRYSGSY